MANPCPACGSTAFGPEDVSEGPWSFAGSMAHGVKTCRATRAECLGCRQTNLALTMLEDS